MKNKSIRVRFAPSPTGWLHIGGLRTALYNFLFARHHGGSFILRIEDTDRNRYVKEAEEDILKSLSWAGLAPDEGPFLSDYNKEKGADGEASSYQTQGEYGPYHQSKRGERYARHAHKLVEKGYAYFAFDTVSEIDRMRDDLRSEENPTPKYDAQSRMKMRNSLVLDKKEVKKLIQDGAEHVIRLKVPGNETVEFKDLVRGTVSFESETLDDAVLLKADGMPTYHLANVVDDHEMKITHVIRGEEWLSSAPKHILLYRYLGWDPPFMAHLPLIMSPSGGKLSKRKAVEEGIPVLVRDYIEACYEPDALINFLALLGWSPGDDREILTLKEMINDFSLERTGKSGAIFDFKKLLWFNELALRNRSDDSLADRLIELAHKKGVIIKHLDDKAFLKGVIRLLKERVSRLPEFLEAGAFFFQPPEKYDEKATKKAWKQGTPELISTYQQRIGAIDENAFKSGLLKETLSLTAEEKGIGFGKLMMPLRLAVTGTGSGPDLFETLELLGKKEVLERIGRAITTLNP